MRHSLKQALRVKTRALGLCCTLVGLAGCGTSAIPEPAISVSLQTERVIKTVRTESKSKPSEKTENLSAPDREPVAKTFTTVSDEQPSPADVPDEPTFEFEPPFPGRLHPFAPPGRVATSANRKLVAEESGVSLKGFANVSGIRAVLLIDGEATTLAEGQQHGDVRVIAIQPPEVTLRRGREVWKETLRRPVGDET